MRYHETVSCVRHEWVWGGGGAMTPIGVNASEGQSLMASQRYEQWSRVERAAPQSEADAMQALDRLYARVIHELRRYRDYAALTGDIVRQERADWLMQRIETNGRQIKDELAGKIRLASPSEQMEMQTAIQAAEDFIDLPIHHFPKTPDDWDLVWDWAKEILLSLRRSFRDFPGTVLDELEGGADASQHPTRETLSPLFLDACPSSGAVQMWTVLQSVEQAQDKHLPAVA